ncbi:type III-A CRISPR-associated protein Csm2 [uncultured Campylobacter sp.]|uniref:type III-A CRISPR-associated protein Csm2 n=1 Tax=uncultured Campylobacter sp. TaxID=218934 RepID=UPI00263139FF|nr:type III-A CRISPR-associated protein Csm2 [uncultured Campylobacter sp.]
MNGYRNSSYNQNFDNSVRNNSLPPIVLDYKKDPNLFDETARKVAELVSAGTKATQIRAFYDYIIGLEQRSNIGDFSEILPFVKMLNSKAAYSNARKHSSSEFVEMINKCVAQVKTKDDLRVFKLFFEAVIGFSKK